MKTIIVCIITLCFIFPIVIAQNNNSSSSRSTEEAEIIGKLSYGKPSDSVKVKQLPDHTVKRSHRVEQGSTPKDLREARRGNNRTDKFKALRQLPNLRAAGARYVMFGDNDKNNERREQMMEFMEGIHGLYEAKEKELAAALSERKRQVEIQAEERKKNPPKPEDMTLLFWNNDGSPKN